MTSPISPYLADILAQPAALQTALDRFDSEALAPLQQWYAKHRKDRAATLLSGGEP